MKEESYRLFESADIETIVNMLDGELQKRNESPIWKERVVPFADAILTILIPLRDSNMLFSPEGLKVDELTPELFFSYCDFVSLKTLAFTIEKSNSKKLLVRTKLEDATCREYKTINIDSTKAYLSANGVDVNKESLDFPIATYNLHQGVSNVIKSLLK